MPLLGRVLLGAALAALPALNGCVTDERAPGLGAYPTSAPPSVPIVRRCVDGESKVCRNYLMSSDGVVDCYLGARRCADGEWGACGGATPAGSEDPTTCELPAAGLSVPLDGGTAVARVQGSGDALSVALTAGDAALATFELAVSSSSREFHLPTRRASFSMVHGGELVAVTAIRIDGRVNNTCSGFDAIAVVLTLADAAGGGALVLTGPTDDD